MQQKKTFGVRGYLAALCMVVLTACGGGGGASGNQTGTAPKVASLDPGVVVLSQAETNQIGVVNLLEGGQTLITAKPQSAMAKLGVGSIAALPAASGDGSFTFVKVMGTQTDANGDIALTVAPPGIDEAFTSLKYSNAGTDQSVKVVGIVTPYGAATVRNGQIVNQVGLTGITPVFTQGAKGMKYGLKIDVEKAWIKDQYKDNNAVAATGCQNANSATDKKWLNQWCNHIGFVGEINFEPGTIDTALDLNRGGDGNLAFAADQPQKFVIRDAVIDADVTMTFGSANFSFGEFLYGEHKKIYEGLSKVEFGSDSSYAKAQISGLSADDKKGKLPIVGFVLSAGGPALVTNASTQLAVAAPLGAVVWVYMVNEVALNGTVTAHLVLDKTTFSIGQQKVGDGWESVSQFESGGTPGPKGSLKGVAEGTLTATIGPAIELDAFAGGIRILNAGAFVGAEWKATGTVDIRIPFRTPAPDPFYEVNGCFSSTLGSGMAVYGGFELKGEFRLGKGWAKRNVATGVEYKFAYPSDRAAFPSDSEFWKVDVFAERCYSTEPPQVSIVSVTQSVIAQGDPNLPPVDIKVANLSVGSVKRWFVSYNASPQASAVVVPAQLDPVSGFLRALNLVDGSTTDLRLPVGSNVIVRVSAIDYLDRQGDSASQSVSITAAFNPASGVSKLADTGITSSQCYQTGSNVLVSCTSPAAIALNSHQDGMTGRDVATPNAADGSLGFSYSLVGSYDKTECVKDNISGLIWEGKPISGLRLGTTAYTNFGDHRSGDVSSYLSDVNAMALCGYTDWRVPTSEELQTLFNYGAGSGAAIDAAWFPNTPAGNHWALVIPALVYNMTTDFGELRVYDWPYWEPHYVRLVR